MSVVRSQLSVNMKFEIRRLRIIWRYEFRFMIFEFRFSALLLDRGLEHQSVGYNLLPRTDARLDFLHFPSPL